MMYKACELRVRRVTYDTFPFSAKCIKAKGDHFPHVECLRLRHVLAYACSHVHILYQGTVYSMRVHQIRDF